MHNTNVSFSSNMWIVLLFLKLEENVYLHRHLTAVHVRSIYISQLVLYEQLLL